MDGLLGVRCRMEACLVNAGQQLDTWTVREAVHESQAWVVCDAWVEGSEGSDSLLWVCEGEEDHAEAMLDRANRLAAAVDRSGHRGLMAIRQVGCDGKRVFVVSPEAWGLEAATGDMEAFGGPAVWAEELLGALSVLHAEKLAHGGIQAAMCRMTDGGGPQLMGYELQPASRSRRDPAVSQDWDVERYLAPELGAAGDAPALASDVYALGVLLWEHMVGRPAFEAIDPHQSRPDLLQAKGLHPSLDPGPAVPTYLRRLIRQMTHPNPMVRLSNADEALEVLRMGSVGVHDLLETFRTPMPAFKRELGSYADAPPSGTPTPVLPPPRELGLEGASGDRIKRGMIQLDTDLLGGVFIGVMVGLLVVVLSLLTFSVVLGG